MRIIGILVMRNILTGSLTRIARYPLLAQFPMTRLNVFFQCTHTPFFFIHAWKGGGDYRFQFIQFQIQRNIIRQIIYVILFGSYYKGNYQYDPLLYNLKESLNLVSYCVTSTGIVLKRIRTKRKSAILCFREVKVQFSVWRASSGTLRKKIARLLLGNIKQHRKLHFSTPCGCPFSYFFNEKLCQILSKRTL